ncbi:MAG: hypothetical protein AAFO69_13900, partial [Bacteroidota bacterium]
MKVRKYDLKTLHPNRSFVSLLLGPASIALIFLGIESLTDDPVIVFAFVAIYLIVCSFFIYRFCYGRLLMEVSDKELKYRWLNKMLFSGNRTSIPISKMSALR